MFRAFRFVDFYEIKNIHIACCPIDPDLKATRAARLKEAFPPDGKGPTTVREWSRMNWLQPVKLDVYETTRKCLETLCGFLASRVSGRNLQVTFDYIACQQKNMQRLLRCFRPLAPLKQFCLGNGGCFYIPLNPPWMESGELKEIRDLMKQEILQLVAGTDCGPPKSSSRYLPFEILSMIIYHSVVDRNPISLNNHNRLDTYRQSSRLTKIVAVSISSPTQRVANAPQSAMASFSSQKPSAKKP
ncbi:hypothetical protein E2P81_ATG09237 [Venturia nashicola]|nr:hypothetical protein E2P81_ATG09237 [Venturia nashicola]